MIINKRNIPLLTNTSLMKLLYDHVAKSPLYKMSAEAYYQWYQTFVAITEEIYRRLKNDKDIR